MLKPDPGLRRWRFGEVMWSGGISVLMEEPPRALSPLLPREGTVSQEMGSQQTPDLHEPRSQPPASRTGAGGGGQMSVVRELPCLGCVLQQPEWTRRKCRGVVLTQCPYLRTV